MIEVQCVSPSTRFDTGYSQISQISQSSMPVDFASYLLSASPPGFELHYSMRDSFGFNPHGSVNRSNQRNEPLKPIIIKKHTVEEEEEYEAQDRFGDNELDSICPWLPDDCFEYELGNLRIKETCPKSPTSPTGKGLKKRVSFADESGLALVAVRILTEASDTPPQLRPEVLSSLTQGAYAGVTEKPPLVLNFSQPASDYVAFRKKLESTNVSLENVILKDYNLMGTVKVKNLSYEKTVKVRVTFDSWETSVDIPATYAPSGNGGASPFDTFSFTINVPPNMDVHKKVLFAIVYVACDTEYWDNNSGANYEVVSADWNVTEETPSSCNTTDRVVFGLHKEEKWTEFSGWRNMDASVPYY